MLNSVFKEQLEENEESAKRKGREVKATLVGMKSKKIALCWPVERFQWDA